MCGEAHRTTLSVSIVTALKSTGTKESSWGARDRRCLHWQPHAPRPLQLKPHCTKSTQAATTPPLSPASQRCRSNSNHYRALHWPLDKSKKFSFPSPSPVQIITLNSEGASGSLTGGDHWAFFLPWGKPPSFKVGVYPNSPHSSMDKKSLTSDLTRARPWASEKPQCHLVRGSLCQSLLSLRGVSASQCCDKYQETWFCLVHRSDNCEKSGQGLKQQQRQELQRKTVYQLALRFTFSNFP